MADDPRVARKSKRHIPDDPEEFRATLGEHLEELRVRIIRVFIVLVVSWLASWYLQKPVYAFLDTTVHQNIRANVEFREAFRNATDPFMLKLRLSFLMALVVLTPWIVLELWGFVKPGLKPVERRAFSLVAPWTLVLFLLGTGFCWLIIPQAIRWFASYLDDFPSASLLQDPGTMVFFVLKMLLAFGLAFQLPLVVYGLGRVGILTPETLLKHWRHATTAIFILAMIITPSNDPGSMLMMAIPLTLLFVVSVYLVKWTVKPKPNADAEHGRNSSSDDS